MTAEHGASDPEIPEQLDDARDAGGADGGTDSPAKSEEQAEGSVVDASVGHQADQPAVEGDPAREAQPSYDGPPPPADIE